MPVIAVLNRKGGSGKTTLATHLAGHCARQKIPVMLGDVDRQKSAQVWLKLRSLHGASEYPAILGWTIDPRDVLRAPVGVSHVVLDTAGGLTGLDLARVVAFADAIVMPVCNSVFDRESTADCHAELTALPRVASGRCKVAAVGMRVDQSGADTEVLEAWAQRHRIAFAGALRQTPAYVHCVERGLTLFDFPPDRFATDMAQWAAVLGWLQPVLHPVHNPALRSTPQVGAALRAQLPRQPTGSSFVDVRIPRAVSAAAPASRPPAPADAAPVATKAPAIEPAPRSLLGSIFGRLFETVPPSRSLPGES
jgi:chromosome partitioning protein